MRAAPFDPVNVNVNDHGNDHGGGPVHVHVNDHGGDHVHGIGNGPLPDMGSRD